MKLIKRTAFMGLLVFLICQCTEQNKSRSNSEESKFEPAISADSLERIEQELDNKLKQFELKTDTVERENK